MHLTRTDPEANLYRYYRMEIVRGLFGDWGLVREWGRIGGSGRVRTDWFARECVCQTRHASDHSPKGCSVARLFRLAKRPLCVQQSALRSRM